MSAQSQTSNVKVGVEQGATRMFVRAGGAVDFEDGSGLKISGVDITASIASKANDAARYVAAGSTKTLTVAANNNQTVKLDTATGSVVTLPPATGSGARFKFLVTVLATSNSHKVQVANAQDFMVGVLPLERTDTNVVLAFAAANSGTVATNSDTITLNRTTTGSVSVGEYFDLEDVAANTWSVNGFLTATTAQATPFSAAV